MGMTVHEMFWERLGEAADEVADEIWTFDSIPTEVNTYIPDELYKDGVLDLDDLKSYFRKVIEEEEDGVETLAYIADAVDMARQHEAAEAKATPTA